MIVRATADAAGILAVDLLDGKVTRLEKITADSSYKVAFKEHIETNYAWKVEVMEKPKSTTGFIPKKGRWQVERSFGWLRQPRSILDEGCSETWKKTILSSKSMLQITFISLIINRI